MCKSRVSRELSLVFIYELCELSVTSQDNYINMSNICLSMVGAALTLNADIGSVCFHTQNAKNALH